uniref:EF-hand domain-containing protein n=1 Tax=Rhizophora mucronata TaxID=61149 RepID=A0A2P2M3W7_RHIMU
MVSKNEPMESLFNSIQALKDALVPLELGIRKAAKDLESCWGVVPKNSDTRNILELTTDLNCAENWNRKSKVQIRAVRKKSSCNGGSDDGSHLVGEERKKGLSIKVPVKTLLGMFSMNSENERQESDYNKFEESKEGLKERGKGNEGGSCVNCFQFAVTWSLLVSGFIQAFPVPFKTSKKRFQKVSDDDKGYFHLSKQGSKPKILSEPKKSELKDQYVRAFESRYVNVKKGQFMSLECLIGVIFDQLFSNLQKFDLRLQESESKACNGHGSTPPQPPAHFDYLKLLMRIWEGRKVDVNGFLGDLRFARVGGIPSSLVGVSSSANEEGGHNASAGSSEETGGSSAQNLASGILSIPLSNVERLRSTLSTVSFTELIELMPQLGRSSKDHPDKKKLFSVQDFFRYTESEGRRFFEELDRDGDGRVTLEDLEIATKKRKLPLKFAREFMRRARSHLFSKSFGWKQFLSLMEQREPTILRAYTSLCLSKSGTLQKSEILASLKNAGLPANEDNAIAMMRFLNADTEESISYGHFRNFMLLVPTDRLQDDPRNIWFEAATVVAVAPPVEIPAESVLRSALAGGLSCALSCALMHPVDTIKTRVQASSLTFPQIISKLPEIGVKGLYRGSIPAIWGQFTSHGLRTGILEASKLVLINVAPTLPEIQVIG